VAVEALGGKVYYKTITVDLSDDVYLIDDVFCLDAVCNTSIAYPDYTSCGSKEASSAYCAKTLPDWKVLQVGEEHHGYFETTDVPQYWRFYVKDPCKAYRFVSIMCLIKSINQSPIIDQLNSTPIQSI